jgi:hypothetical protein
MKSRNLMVACSVLLLPVGMDMLIRFVMKAGQADVPTLSNWFGISYLAALPFYLAYVAIVLTILALYNQYMRKSKSKKE